VRVSSDPWTATVASYVSRLGADETVSPGEVLSAIDIGVDKRTAQMAQRVGAILRDLGWTATKRHMTRGVLYHRHEA